MKAAGIFLFDIIVTKGSRIYRTIIKRILACKPLTTVTASYNNRC